MRLHITVEIESSRWKHVGMSDDSLRITKTEIKQSWIKIMYDGFALGLTFIKSKRTM